MATKNLKTRIQNKHDTEANWAKATTFKPLAGELIIYDKDSNNAKPRFKIGDGITTVTNLPFVAIDYDGRITSLESTVNGLGTAAQKDVGFFATAAQGTKADNAVPNTRKVNNKALSTDIRLEPNDVGVTESAFPGLKKTGTITGITMNGASKGTSGVVDLGTVLTSSDNLAKLDTENTFTAKQTINSGYGAVSLKTQGYVEISASYAPKSTIGGLFGFKDDGTGRIYAVVPRDLGFVERIKMNNSSIEPGDTGTVDLGTVLTTHQTIKTLKTNNDTAQEVSASEAISGSGTINLHKVAKTGSYNDLLNKPAAVTENTVSGWGFTKNTGTITGIKMNGSSKGTSGVVDLGTVLTNASAFATSAQGTKADNAMPKSGGTFTGDISVPKTITFTDNTNPYIKMTTPNAEGAVDFYFQSTNGQFGLGPTWAKATHWDSNGNVTFPTVPKVGSTSLVLTSAFSLSGTTLTITV